MIKQKAPKLFIAVQTSTIFDDSKTFVDCIPKDKLRIIEQRYIDESRQSDFDLKAFVLQYFELPSDNNQASDFVVKKNIWEHIESLWPYLTQQADAEQTKKLSLIPLPYPYIIPGGRFREIYYWDSYFTSEGLAVSGHFDLVINMANNIAHLIDTVGHMPNGNRNYYLSRSQPPFFVCLLDIIKRYADLETYQRFMPSLEREYQFWMHSFDQRVVKLDQDFYLNRYWDGVAEPRPESYHEDIDIYNNASDEDKINLYQNIRATCESGWDFSSRWCKDANDLTTICTTELIPIDLNAILCHVEKALSKFYTGEKSEWYKNRYERRLLAINHYCWDQKQGFYFDYNWKTKQKMPYKTLAAASLLFFQICNQQQAERVAQTLEQEFLFTHGLITTLTHTEQQWDKPNGWAPLQWLAIRGLLNYGFDNLAKEIASRWLAMNEKVFNETGKMLEKYDVCDPEHPAGGGEYPLQDGFGWTNGVALKLRELFQSVSNEKA